jgi:DNA-binding transcriptional LysR family regulator
VLCIGAIVIQAGRGAMVQAARAFVFRLAGAGARGHHRFYRHYAYIRLVRAMLYTQLRSFHAVASEGGFTAASKVLRIGQPTITSQVRALEDAFDVELFYRRGRGVVREAIDYLNELSGFQSGHLRLGAVGPYNIIDMVSAFSSRYPDLEITVRFGNSREMLERLIDFQVDVAVLARIEDEPRFYSIPYSTDRILALMRKDHPLAMAGGIRLEALMGETLLMRETGSTTRRAVEQGWCRAKLSPRRVIELGSREAVWIAALRGLGIGFVSEAEVMPHEELVTRPIRGSRIETTDHVVCLAERREARIVKAFLAVIEGLMGNCHPTKSK